MERWPIIVALLVALFLFLFMLRVEMDLSNILSSSSRISSCYYQVTGEATNGASIPREEIDTSSIPSEYFPDGRRIHMLALEANNQTQDAIALCSVYSIAKANPTRPGLYLFSFKHIIKDYNSTVKFTIY